MKRNTRTRKNTYRTFAGVSLLGYITLVFLLSCAGNTKSVAQQPDATIAKDELKQDTLSVIAVGDMMLGSAYPTSANLPHDDARGSFKQVKDFLKGDIVFGNLEGCFLDQGKSTKCKDTTGNSCFAFRMPQRYAEIYKDAGFNLLSVANNHVGDFGSRGRKRTTTLLDSLNIHYAGLSTHPYTIFEKDSVTYAFCAFSPNDQTLSINEIDSAAQLVTFLKERANIVIVSFHGGAEGSKFEHVTKADEIFYKENRGNVYAFSHAVIDAGADLVLGHGPHVTRAVEVYKKKFIAYSLGNFCTYGMFNLKGPNGSAPILDIKINSNGDFLYAKVISTKQDKINRLTLDPTQAAFKKISLLTGMDFPGNQLLFTHQTIQLKD